MLRPKEATAIRSSSQLEGGRLSGRRSERPVPTRPGPGPGQGLWYGRDCGPAARVGCVAVDRAAGGGSGPCPAGAEAVLLHVRGDDGRRGGAGGGGGARLEGFEDHPERGGGGGVGRGRLGRVGLRRVAGECGRDYGDRFHARTASPKAGFSVNLSRGALDIRPQGEKRHVAESRGCRRVPW